MTPLPAPYYQTALGTLYHGDCLEVMRELPDASVDAVVTDPPYCSGANTEAGKGRKISLLREGKNDDWIESDSLSTAGASFLMRSVAVALKRIALKGSSMMLFTDWRMMSHVADAIESANWKRSNLVVWDKGSIGLGRGFRARHELAWHFTHGVGTYYRADAANVIQCPKCSTSLRIHPTEKPIALLKEILSVVAPPNGVILDPFFGSGPIAIACEEMGLRWIGIELDERWCDLAVRRLQQPKQRIMGV